MPRLPLLVLLPLAHAVRVVTPFRSAPARMAASVPSVDPALKLVLRAAGDRGKADLSSLRALAGLIGMDDGLRALEEQLGISENVTDTDIQARALILAQPRLIRTPALRHEGGPSSTPTAPLPLARAFPRIPIPHPTAPAPRAIPRAGAPSASDGESVARPGRGGARHRGSPVLARRRRRVARERR